MKKVFAILSLLVVLLSGATIRFSAHYCQGVFIASRLSVTGENASCGMTQEKSEPGQGNHFSNLMCANELSSFTFSDNYIFSPNIPNTGKHQIDIEFPLVITPKTNLISVSPGFEQIPPGIPGQQKAESKVLCVFRI